MEDVPGHIRGMEQDELLQPKPFCDSTILLFQFNANGLTACQCEKKNPRSLKYIGIFKDLMFLKPVGSLAVASSRWAFVIPELTGVHFHWENLKGG